MKIAADTNLLLRLVLDDNREQRVAAVNAFNQAECVAIAVTSLCEFCWVLQRSSRLRGDVIAFEIRRLLSRGNVVTDRAAVEAGLDMLEAGGDFADGVIAYEGRRLGGETFASFDREAVAILQQQGQPAVLLA